MIKIYGKMMIFILPFAKLLQIIAYCRAKGEFSWSY